MELSRNCAKKSVASRNAPLTLFTCFPYLCGTSDQIKGILNEIEIKIAMKPHKTVDKFLLSPKDALNKREISGIIYQLLCHDCKFTYVGQTKRDVKL